MLNLRNYFTVAAIMRRLRELPELKTPVMDTIFTHRPQQPLALIGADDLKPVIQEMPLVRRGARSIPVLKESGGISFYEPFPFRPDKFIGGSDLNNLKVLGESSLETWATNKTDMLRRIIRKSTEAICAISLGGTLDYPVQLENGGFEHYVVDYGNVLSHAPNKLLDATGAKLKDAFDALSDMQEAIQENGYGGTLEIWAGKTAYGALFALAEASTTTAKIRVEITDQGINIGGFLIKRRSEKYRNPETGTATSILDAKKIRMIATDADHFLPYCALDDLSAKLQPIPFFVKPIIQENPSGLLLVGESKPFPVPNVRGICDATVVG